MARALAAQLPGGLTLIEARAVDPRAPSLNESVRALHYAVEFPEGWSEDALRQRISDFQAAEQAVVLRSAPPKARSGKRNPRTAAPKERHIDLKELVTHLALEGPRRVAFSVRADPSGSAKPAEVLARVFGDGAPPQGVRILKEGVSFARTGGQPATARPRAPRYADA